MSKILCIIDGMTDDAFRPEAYPALASFPERSRIQTVPDGFEAETLPCVLSLLGVSAPPKNIRGWIEAVGAGIDVAPDDLVLRGSWLELDGGGVCVGFCAAPSDIPAPGAARYFPCGDYKGLLIVPGCASHAGDLRTPLPFYMLGRRWDEDALPDLPFLKEALAVINGAAPNRAMFPWAASAARAMPQFPGRAAAVCGTNVVKGIAKVLGMSLVTEAGMTGDTDTDLDAKTRSAVALAETFPFVLLHIGGCDEAAHRRDTAEKKDFLSKVDAQVLSRLLSSGHEIDVVSDHGSDPATGRHIGGEQPLFRRGDRTGE